MSSTQFVCVSCSTDDAAKGRTLPQVPDEVLDAAEVAAQELLLLLGGEHPLVVAVGLLAGEVRGREGAGELTRAALEHGGHGVALVGPRDRGHLGHEVEVEELDELELNLAGGGAGLEEGGDGEEAVEGLEGAGVARGVDEGDDEGEEGRGLDRGAVVRLEEVKEKLLGEGKQLSIHVCTLQRPIRAKAT